MPFPLDPGCPYASNLDGLTLKPQMVQLTQTLALKRRLGAMIALLAAFVD